MIIVSGTCTYRHDVMWILRTLPLLKTLCGMLMGIWIQIILMTQKLEYIVHTLCNGTHLTSVLFITMIYHYTQFYFNTLQSFQDQAYLFLNFSPNEKIRINYMNIYWKHEYVKFEKPIITKLIMWKLVYTVANFLFIMDCIITLRKRYCNIIQKQKAKIWMIELFAKNFIGVISDNKRNFRPTAHTK